MSPRKAPQASKLDQTDASKLEPGSGETGAKHPAKPGRASVDTDNVERGVDQILEQYPAQEASLIMVLQEVQDHFNWLPPESLQRVAERLELPIAKVRGVATFYKAFSLEPKGRKTVKVCVGTACHVRGAGMLTEELERSLRVKANKGMTEDGEFSVETVNCIGACSMAPAVVVGDKYYANMTPGNLSTMVKKERKS